MTTELANSSAEEITRNMYGNLMRLMMDNLFEDKSDVVPQLIAMKDALEILINEYTNGDAIIAE